ncbi:MAG: MopE-related protein [Candidatus Gracilibacteria bacterium]
MKLSEALPFSAQQVLNSLSARLAPSQSTRAAVAALMMSVSACTGTDHAEFGNEGGSGGTGAAGQGGSGGAECVPTNPADEVCDGVDNDCDGEIDNDLLCSCDNGDTRECGTDEGVCQKGTEECVDGLWSGECQDSIAPVLEECGDNLDNDCDGKVNNGCDVSVSFPALSGADCYKAVHFLSGGVTIDGNSSTPDSAICTKAGVMGTYQPGDRAQVWWESTESPLMFSSSEEPKSVEIQCSNDNNPNWQESTTAVQSTDYSHSENPATVEHVYNDQTGENTVTPVGCDPVDIRVTF